MAPAQIAPCKTTQRTPFTMAPFSRLPVALLLAVLAAVSATASPDTGGCRGLARYGRLFAFGNSLTDTGNAAINPVTAGTTFTRLPYGETFPGHPSGRASDGRIIVDFLVGPRRAPARPSRKVPPLRRRLPPSRPRCHLAGQIIRFGDGPLAACCGGGGGPYNFNFSTFCGVPGWTTCLDPSKYISWDGIHYTPRPPTGSPPVPCYGHFEPYVDTPAQPVLLFVVHVHSGSNMYNAIYTLLWFVYCKKLFLEKLEILFH
ncbi:hypothetical protein ACP70R_019344 [Stipagrostis hirtigluma subsp. patula]